MRAIPSLNAKLIRAETRRRHEQVHSRSPSSNVLKHRPPAGGSHNPSNQPLKLGGREVNQAGAVPTPSKTSLNAARPLQS